MSSIAGSRRKARSRHCSAGDVADAAPRPHPGSVRRSTTRHATRHADPRPLRGGHAQGSATIFVPRVSGSVHTQAPVKIANSEASEIPPPNP